MRPTIVLRRLLFFSALLPPLGLAAVPAAGQSAPATFDGVRFGIGYVANAPGLVAGGNGYVIFPYMGGIGVYVDAKFDVDNPSGDQGFLEDLTATDVANQVQGADYIDGESSWRSVNLALVRPVSQFLMAYGGVGVAHRTRYHLYEEPSRTYGLGGVFWVEAPADEENRVNLMVGLLMRVSSRVSTQFGVETQPRGFTVGASLRLPAW